MKSEWEQKVDKRISRYSYKAMSNTKWREVFKVLLRHGVQFEVKNIWDDLYRNGSALSLQHLTQTGIQDPGIGGPLLYKEIETLRIPIFESKRNPLKGTIHQDRGRSDKVIKDLNQLGELPVEQTDKHVVLAGYLK